MYRGTFTVLPNVLFWVIWIITIFVLVAHPQSSILCVQMGSNWYPNRDLLPNSQLSPLISEPFVFSGFEDVSPRFNPRYVTVMEI